MLELFRVDDVVTGAFLIRILVGVAYEVFKSINVKACFCGHDHKNYSDIFYKNEMILSYGLKATDLDYHAENLFGYKIITLPENPAEFSLSSIASTFYLYQ
jgi:hypothetical protein